MMRSVRRKGSAKLTLNAGSTKLFVNDKHSRVEVFFTSAIGFKDGKVPANISLNVWLEGNVTAKANATLKVKISIVR